MMVMKAPEKKLRSSSFYNDFCESTKAAKAEGNSSRDGCTSICQGTDINSHIFKKRQQRLGSPKTSSSSLKGDT